MHVRVQGICAAYGLNVDLKVFVGQEWLVIVLGISFVHIACHLWQIKRFHHYSKTFSVLSAIPDPVMYVLYKVPLFNCYQEVEVFYLFMIRGGLRFDTTSSFGMYPKGLFHFIDHPVPGLLLSIPYRCSFGKMYFSYLLSPSQRSSKVVFESPLSASVILSPLPSMLLQCL